MAGIFAAWQPRYEEHGIATFPVTEEKKPAVGNFLKAGRPASRQWALKFPANDAFGFACGPRNRITVLDVDTPNERVLAEAMDRHGPTPFVVRSGSGNWQAWYRHNGEGRRIRPEPSLPIDILGGRGFVVAPPSRVAKGRYEIVQGSLDDLARLPTMRAVAAEPEKPEKPATPPIESMRDGDGRNPALFGRGLRLARGATTEQELMTMLVRINETFAEPMDLNEVQGITHSIWSYKQAGRLMVAGAETPAMILPSELDVLQSNPHAILLLLRLRLAHGWRKGGQFALSNAMAASMGISVNTFRAARDMLAANFFVRIIHPGGKGKHNPPLAVLL